MAEIGFTARDGTTLYERHWVVPNARGTVIILHGFGHHSGSFAGLAARLNAAGYSAYGFDQRGHGNSPGRRARIRRFVTLIDDLDCYLSRLLPEMGARPVFVFGHSLGALVLGLYIIEKRPALNGVIFSSGLLMIPAKVSHFLRRIARLLSAVTPWAPVQRVDVGGISRDPERVAASIADPLGHSGMMNARTGGEIAVAVAQLEKRMAEITLPMLILHGTGDRLTDWQGSQRLYDAARAADKTLSIYEGGFHELFNDLEQERFVREVVTWLDARTDPPAPN